MSDDIRLQVAFAGHNRISDIGDAVQLAVALDTAFQLLKHAGVTRARMLTGLAPGADHIAAEAWRRARLGPIHAIYPFLPPRKTEKDAGRRFAKTATWLDGEAIHKMGRNPHLNQTRWMLSRAELLVVAWSGAPGRGAGGTADAVRIALESGIPVLWVRPGSHEVRVIGGPDQPHLNFLEVLEHVGARGDAGRAADPHLLASALGLNDVDEIGLDRDETSGRLHDWLHGWLWRTFAIFQRTVGGPSAPRHPADEPPADMADQPGYLSLSAAYATTDRRASRLAAVHRSEQLLLVLAAVVAAVIGAAPSLWPQLKLTSVMGELALGLLAFAVWWSAGRARRHERWTAARRLAEQIRLERAAWAMGLSSCGLGTPSMRYEYRSIARVLLKQAQPPVAVLDASRLEVWSAWAMAQLVDGQALYHHQQARRSGRISHRIQVFEDGALFVLFIALAAYAVSSVIAPRYGLDVPDWASGLVMMASVVVPSISAAGMALEAKLEFEHQAERSAELAERLDELGATLQAADWVERQSAARRAIEWLLAEADQWREAVGRRRLFRGG
jgi:hypothetical protein